MVVAFLCLAGVNESYAQPQLEKYIEKYAALAVEMMNEYEIPASIILAVAVVESAACSSRNCRLLNNHFGIKAGKKYKIPGTNHWTSYKSYKNDTASYRHFCQWIVKRKFYQDICGKMDYNPWIQSISRSGYTMSPSKWSSKVRQVIQKHHLDQHDFIADPLIKPQ